MSDDLSLNQLVREHGHDLLGLEVGSDIKLTWMVDSAGLLVGAFREHPREGSPLEQCVSVVLFDTPAGRFFGEMKKPHRPIALHAVDSWQPLTLSPSLQCRTCGSHGWIKESTWQPA